MKNETINPLQEYKIVYFYHTDETAKTKVIARCPNDARQIAEMTFRKNYTDQCILDRVEVVS